MLTKLHHELCWYKDSLLQRPHWPLSHFPLDRKTIAEAHDARGRAESSAKQCEAVFDGIKSFQPARQRLGLVAVATPTRILSRCMLTPRIAKVKRFRIA